MTTEQSDAIDAAPAQPSRLQKAIAATERAASAAADPWIPADAWERAVENADPEDYTTADERLASFWRKYKDADAEFKSSSARRDLDGGHVEWTVTVVIEVTEAFRSRTASASATRASNDPNLIVRARPHDSAQTAALSRALRFLGIRLQTRAKS